jgi:hypothetical protein
MQRILTLATILFLTAVPALAAGGNHSANQDAHQAARDAKHDQRAIDANRAAAARNAASAVTDAVDHPNHQQAARDLAAEARHLARADALLAGCPTCH